MDEIIRWRHDRGKCYQPIGSLAVVVVHEMVHWYQSTMQGAVDYVSLYRKPGADTLLAGATAAAGG